MNEICKNISSNFIYFLLLCFLVILMLFKIFIIWFRIIIEILFNKKRENKIKDDIFSLKYYKIQRKTHREYKKKREITLISLKNESQTRSKIRNCLIIVVFIIMHIMQECS